jgi:hypothetical protein
MKNVQDIGQKEEHRPETEHSENIGEKDQIGVFGNGENGGNRIYSKYQVCKFNNHQYNKQGSGHPFPRLSDKEILSHIAGKNGKEPGY